MSRMIWSATLIPDLSLPAQELVDASYNALVENVRPYPVADKDISIPDPRAFRAMSRASIFISHLCQQAMQHMKPLLDQSPFSVGVYCAVENGPIDAPSTLKILNEDPARFSEFYRKYRNPKMYLKQLPNVVPAQLGISLGLQGPMNVYTHSLTASLHALEQAEWDLKAGTVSAALVCSAHAFDDFMQIKRARHHDIRTLNEGAGACLLVRSQEFINWPAKIEKDEKNFFGIADPIINLLKGESNVSS